MKKISFISRVFFLITFPMAILAQWEVQTIDAAISYRSMDTDGKGCIWAGGSQNTVSFSCDYGSTWESVKVGLEYKLDFRGISVLNENEIVAMSAGMGNEGAAKIYKTSDKGKTWKKVYTNSGEAVFMDGLKFFNEKEGIVYGDPIDGRLFLIKTSDGGETWSDMSAFLPPVIKGEASYAASNTNISIHKSKVWIATQNRIFQSVNKGASWSVLKTPFTSGKTAGIFGLHLSKKMGIAVGGDYVDDKADYQNIAIRKHKAENWTFEGICKPLGLKEAVLPLKKNVFLILGTSGTSLFNSKESRCVEMDRESFHTGVCDNQNCYAIGGKGRVGVWVKAL